jgi:hypothetical protein
VAIGGSGGEPPATSPADDPSSQPAPPGRAARRRRITRAQVGRFIQAVRDSDQAAVDEMILRLSRSRPWLAPLALAVGAFAMLFTGVKLLFTNWRLTLIQVLPAMWIWFAMYDLKAKVLRGKQFIGLSGPAMAAWIVVGITVITAASFYLNAVFAFAIIQPGRPAIRPAFTKARSHLPIVLGSGAVVGVLLGLSAIVVPRYWGNLFWFAVSLSIVIGIMMVCYVAVPSRLIGIKPRQSRRDKLTASAVGGAVGAVICTPPYALGRVGLILLGSHTLFALGIILFAVGLTLQAGATGAVKTIKMSAKLLPGRESDGAAEDTGQQGSPLADEAGAPPPAGSLRRGTTRKDRHAASSEEPFPGGGHSGRRLPGGRLRERRQQRDQQLAHPQPDRHGLVRLRHDRSRDHGGAHDRPRDHGGAHDRPRDHGGARDHDRHGHPRHVGAHRLANGVRDAGHRVRHQPAVAVDPAGRRGRGRPDRVDRQLGSPPFGAHRRLAVAAHRRVREGVGSARRDERGGGAGQPRRR